MAIFPGFITELTTLDGLSDWIAPIAGVACVAAFIFGVSRLITPKVTPVAADVNLSSTSSVSQETSESSAVVNNVSPASDISSSSRTENSSNLNVEDTASISENNSNLSVEDTDSISGYCPELNIDVSDLLVHLPGHMQLTINGQIIAMNMIIEMSKVLKGVVVVGLIFVVACVFMHHLTGFCRREIFIPNRNKSPCLLFSPVNTPFYKDTSFEEFLNYNVHKEDQFFVQLVLLSEIMSDIEDNPTSIVLNKETAVLLLHWCAIAVELYSKGDLTTMETFQNYLKQYLLTL